MKKEKTIFLIVYAISFVITWLCYIFYIEKTEFDLEFRKKERTKAIIFNLGTYEVEEELYDGKKTNIHELSFVEYSFKIDGTEYKSSSSYFNEDYSISDSIEIEYVKYDPRVTKIVGQGNYRYNYFLRNLMPVIVISLMAMIFIISILDFLIKLIRPNR